MVSEMLTGAQAHHREHRVTRTKTTEECTKRVLIEKHWSMPRTLCGVPRCNSVFSVVKLWFLAQQPSAGLCNRPVFLRGNHEHEYARI